MDAVTDVLQAREERRQAFTPMVVVSAAAHVAAFVVLALMSLHAASTPPPTVFQITFTGSEGPRTGGANPIGARAVEQVAPPQPKSPAPPPPPTPKMVVPEERPIKKPRPESTTARAETPAVKPPLSGGEAVRPGSTKIETPVKGPGFGSGLSSGGGPGSGVSLDVTDFCCMEYIGQVSQRIKSNWKEEQGRAGKVIVKFTIHRDGTLDGAEVEQSSGFGPLDFEARRAVQLTPRVEQLPTRFAGQQLTVHLTFTYER